MQDQVKICLNWEVGGQTHLPDWINHEETMSSVDSSGSQANDDFGNGNDIDYGAVVHVLHLFFLRIFIVVKT